MTFEMFISPENWSENENWTKFMKNNKVLEVFEQFGNGIRNSISEELIERNINAGLVYCESKNFNTLHKFIDQELVYKKCFKLDFWMVVTSQTENRKLRLIINDNSFSFEYSNDEEIIDSAKGDFKRIQKPIIKTKWTKILRSMLSAQFPNYENNQEQKIVYPFIHVIQMEFVEGSGIKPFDINIR